MNLAKRALLVACLVLTTPAAQAAGREPDAPFAPLKLDPAELARTYRRAAWRRNVGIGLSVPGVALTILGCVLIGYGANDPHLASGGVELAIGLAVGVPGVLLATPGVVLWIMGQDAMDVASWRRAQLGAAPAGLSVSF